MMRSFRRIVLEAGIVGGLLFTIHASIPYSKSWPFIWPALAGATAVWLATRGPQPHRWRSGLAAALVTGVISGAIAFVGISTVVYVVVHTGIAPAVRQMGESSETIMASLTAATIVAIAASLAAIDVIVAFVGGVLMLPARYFQIRHAQA
jgi:hypothetical protein